MNINFSSNYEIKQFIAIALNEDLRDGDQSSLSCIPALKTDTAKLLVKDQGIIAGVELAQTIIEMVDPQLEMEVLIKDGSNVSSASN